MAEVLPFNRMYPLKYHEVQAALWASQARFNVVPAGRRSGKTEIVGKRKVVYRALRGTPYPDPRFFCAAPTRDQAKRIYWKDLKLMVPRNLIYRISESMLQIFLLNGAEIHVLGMDKPERIEGVPWDGGVLDEYANMKKQTWTDHVRAALSDRNGWCDFIGVPEGRNHYYELDREAKARAIADIAAGRPPVWNSFWWPSSDILPSEEIEEAKRDLDELTFKQEYEGSFINFTGRAYYAFEERTHCARLEYDANKPLSFCFDFNVSPGVAVVVQEQWLPTSEEEETWGDGIIGEVWIPRNSNTKRVCDKLYEDYKDHAGPIICYGDQTGGSKGTAKLLGSDWQIIKDIFWNKFGSRKVSFKVPPSNPRERDRVNSVNTRLRTVDGNINCMVDPSRAPNMVRDFEGVVLIEGGTGEIDKDTDSTLTHLTDAYGYRVWREYPLKKRYARTGRTHWK